MVPRFRAHTCPAATIGSYSLLSFTERSNTDGAKRLFQLVAGKDYVPTLDVLIAQGLLSGKV